MNDEPSKKRLNGKNIAIVLTVIVTLIVITIFGLTQNKNSDDTLQSEVETAEDSGENSDENNEFDETDELDEVDIENMEKDNREILDDTEADIVLQDVFNLLSNDRWDEVPEILARYDEEYNLEATTKGKYLQDIMWDTDALIRFKQDGEDYERIIKNVPQLVKLNTPEAFIYALYSLPRRYILELSEDSLALAPSHRGDLLLKDRTYIPAADEDGNRNDDIDEYELIKSHINNLNLGDYDTAYYKYDITHNGVIEEVYIAKNFMDEWRLIGIYSQDEYYQNISETVSHFLEFSRDVGEGVDKMLEIEDEKRQKELDEFERERELLSGIE